MDLSDGLADALRQVARASGCGVRIDASCLPIDRQAREWWEAEHRDAVRAAIAGGDDYELLFAVPKRGGRLLRAVHQRVSTPLTRIGVFTKQAGELVVERDGRDEELPEGYEHFRDPSTGSGSS
jgi:thiamine-monophosphate kinase